MLEIVVLSRPAALNYHSPDDIPYGLVSITNPGDDEVVFGKDPKRIGLLRLAFDDVTAQDPPYVRSLTLFSMEDADRLLNFVEQSVSPVTSRLIVHCEMGISRSRGVALALETIYEGTSHHSKHGYPNGLVVRRIIAQHESRSSTNIDLPVVIRRSEHCEKHPNDGLRPSDDIRICRTCGAKPIADEWDLIATTIKPKVKAKD